MENSADGGEWLFLSFSLRHCHPFQLFYISFSIMQLMRTWSGGKGAKLGWPPVLLQLHLGAEQSIQAWVPALEGNGVSAYRNRRELPSVPAAREGTWDTGTHCCQHELLSCPPTRYIFYLEKLIPISSIAWLLHTDQSTFLSFPNKLGSSSKGKYFPLVPFPACSFLAPLGAC